MEELKFNVQETSSDKITFRYSPKKKKKPLGNLKPTKLIEIHGHRVF